MEGYVFREREVTDEGLAELKTYLMKLPQSPAYWPYDMLVTLPRKTIAIIDELQKLRIIQNDKNKR